MAKSSVSRRENKPRKPYPDFPLFPHATRRWAKKIRGKFVYFGPWDDPDGALQKYLDEKDDLHAGRTPRKSGDGLTVAEMCNQFLTAKRHLLDTSELTDRSFRDYYQSCDRLVSFFGKTRLVDDIAADDFGSFRASMAKKRGPVSLGNEIGRLRVVFKFAYDNSLIDKPIRYGQGFNKPSRATLRKERAKNGPRMFEAIELRQILDAAPQVMRAMVLLAINGGLGNSDVSNLPLSAIDFDSGWIDYPRPKTGVERRVPLWPETAKALQEAIALRPEPKDTADDNCVFLTRRRNRWVRMTANQDPEKRIAIDAVAVEFRKLLKRLGINGRRNFYAIRHSFQTVAEECRDMPAVKSIMGHVDDSMSGRYRERISDSRLGDVVAVVHRWLFV